MADAIESPGALTGIAGPEDGVKAMIDNRTSLPDEMVRDAIMAQWVEVSGLQFGQPTTFQLYATGRGNMLDRQPFLPPTTILDEIKLARQVAETDDDVTSAIDWMIAAAFGDGMENLHRDEPTQALFNQAAFAMNLDVQLKEIYREYLIASQFTTISVFTRKRVTYTPEGSNRELEAQLFLPNIGVLPSENIRVMTNDIFGTAELAYDVPDENMKRWLNEFFDPATSAARRDQMRTEEPLLAAVFTGVQDVPWNDPDPFIAGKKVYTLNPRMCHRATMPKGAAAYPRPLLTANFAILEAKRLLNVMDYALLQGGTNYIIIAKQGSDQRPAQQPEIDNLTWQVQNAGRSGVLVGDHRLSVEIVTPKLDELLNPAKRRLIGRKLAMRLLRQTEHVTDDPGAEGAKQELELAARVITSDRRDIKRHVERYVYKEVAQRNRSKITSGAPAIWFPKIILSGVKDFFASVLQARDRGDIPRKWGVEVLGFDYEAGVAQRKREHARGDDEVMVPGNVPFDSANPGGGGQGRPPGASPNNGRPGGQTPRIDPAQRQRQLIPRTRGGEPVRSVWDEDRQSVIRYGELTVAVLEQFPEHTVGRVTQLEQSAAWETEPTQQGAVSVIPLNHEARNGDLRAFRLAEGLSLLVGQRLRDDAMMTYALSLREPQFDLQRGIEMAVRWGFIEAVEASTEIVKREPSVTEQVIAAVRENPEAFAQALAQVVGGFVPPITINMPNGSDG